MLFLVALLYLVSFASAVCTDQLSTLTTCIASSVIPGKPSICDCYNTFATSLKDCDDTQINALKNQVATIQSACPGTQIGITPTDCITSGAALGICLTFSTVPNSKSACDCYTDYKAHSDQYCTTSKDKLFTYPFCLQAQALCSSLPCVADCSLFESDYEFEVETDFQACVSQTNADHCACFDASKSMVGEFTTSCNGAAKVQLSSCIEAQLDCPSLLTGEQCETVEVELKIEDISSLFDKAKDKFISNWNTKFTTDGKSITVTTCDKTTNGDNEIVFTIDVNYDETKQNLDQVVADLKKVLSVTIGLPETKLSGKATAGAKRSVLSTATVTMTGTGNAGGGAASLSFVMIPVLVITGIFHYFF